MTGSGALKNSSDSRLIAKLLLMALFWGGTFIAGRHLATTVPHSLAASVRYWLACACLLPFAVAEAGSLKAFVTLSPAQWLATMACGATGIAIYNITFFGALELLPGSRTALIVALNPILTAVLAAWVFRDRLKPMQWLGVVVALSGTAIVISKGEVFSHPGSLFSTVGKGELIMLVGVVAWAIYTVSGRIAVRKMSAMVATTWACLWGTFMLTVWALWRGDLHGFSALSWLDVTGIVYLGVFATAISFVWFYEGVAILGPARTAVFTNLVPVFGVLLSGLMLKEPLLPSMLIGGVVVMGGVYLTQRGR